MRGGRWPRSREANDSWRRLPQQPTSASGGILSCRVNDQDVEIPLTESGWTLLDVLRDLLGITSPKNGCQPQAQCGCCTVLMDGKPVLSCALTAEKAEGKSITTLEGLDEEHRQQIAESFVRCGGVQCGFCIPGHGDAGRGAVRAMRTSRRATKSRCRSSRILCRCTGYTQIVDSIEQYAKLRRGEPLPEPSAADQSGNVGTNLPRYTGHDAVLGDRKFIDDMIVPNMLYGAVRLTDHPRAKVLEIDATRGARACRACIAWSRRPMCRATATSGSSKKIGRCSSRLAKRRAARATSSPASSPTRSGWPARRPS